MNWINIIVTLLAILLVVFFIVPRAYERAADEGRFIGRCFSNSGVVMHGNQMYCIKQNAVLEIM